MIKDIQELNFPSYATMSAATVSLPDMGEWNITSQIKVDGQIAPDFSFDWEVVHDGHKYIMPLRIPAGSKDNQKPPSVIDLTFQHWAIWQLKRFPFVTMQPIDSGTAVADEEVATPSLNLGDFCNLFGQVLEYYYGDKITIQLNPDWQYKAEAEVITISHTKVWNVLIEVFYKQFGVRWAIEPNGGYDKYVIKVGYPTTEQSHIFEYGFEGGLMKVERQVQSEEICNLLKGRGGEKNLPYRYFKNVDPENDTFKADPDWIEELANIYFSNLMPATFRSYVQGWKAAHISKYPGYTATGEANAYAPWAYRKGFTDTKFHPVEFVADEITVTPEVGDRQVEILPGYSPSVKKGSSLDKYGPLMNSLDNNDEIYPTIQGVTVDPYGRIDEVVEVEPITSDDEEGTAESDAEISKFEQPWPKVTEKIEKNTRKTIELTGDWFTVPTGKTANFHEGRKIIALTVDQIEGYYDSKTHRWLYKTTQEPIEDSDHLILEGSDVDLLSTSGEIVSASGIPSGTYRYRVRCRIHNTSETDYNITVLLESPTLTDATIDDKRFKSTWRIWVKNIWQTSKSGDETDAQYAERIWRPILGDREGNEAKVVFASGALAHEDYEFTIVTTPKYERKLCKWQTVEKGQIVEHEYWSEWCVELGKSDADLDALGVYLPSVMRQAIAGDFFFFIGIDMPHLYVKWGEERVDNWKKDNLQDKKDIKPTWVVQTDRVRLNNEGKEDALIRQLHPGDTLRLADKRFIEGDYETLYLSSLTITYREPTKDDAALNPDVEIVLSDRYEVSANPVATLQGEVEALTKQVGSISNVEQIVRAVGDKLYLRKDGIADRSISPTEFASLLTSLGFRSGMVGGAGWGIYKDANGNWVIEADRFMARQDLEVNSLIINQVEGKGGTEVDSAARMEIIRVDEVDNGYKCYFDQHEGTVANLFHVDDIAWNSRFTPENEDLKNYRRRVTEVGVDYVILSDTDVYGDGIPAVGDVIVHRGNYTDANRQYIKVRDVIGGGYERYIEGLDSVEAEGVEYYFVGRIAGQNPRWFVGNRDLIPYSGEGDGSFIEYKDREFNLNNVILSIGSRIGNTTLGDIVQGFDDSKYLREALNQSTIVNNGLVLTSAILLGKTNDLGERETWAGHNGLYQNPRNIASFWGGDMVDRFYDEDGNERISPLVSGYAASLVRMNGSFYFCNGNIGGNADGSGWLGNYDNGIRFGADGSMTFGSGIKINLSGGSEGLQQTLQSIVNFQIALTNLLAPCDVNDNEISWTEAAQNDVDGSYKAKSLKAKLGLWSPKYISALGKNPNAGEITLAGASALADLTDVTLTNPLQSGQSLVYDGTKWVNLAIQTGGGGTGLDTTALAQYLTQNQYAKKSDIPSLSGYATELWVNSTYVKKSGDTMSGTLALPRLNIVGSASSDAYISSDTSYNAFISVGGAPMMVWNSNDKVIRASVAGNDIYSLGSSAVRWKNVYATTINVSSTDLVSNLNADLLDGLQGNEYARNLLNVQINANSYDSLPGLWGGKLYNATNTPFAYYPFLHFGRDEWFAQFNAYNNVLYFRASGQGNDAPTWRKVAFEDSNVASATQLANTRTLWGQNFNGTANVSGNMSEVGSISHSAGIVPTANNAVRLGSADYNYQAVYSRQFANNIDDQMAIWQAKNYAMYFATNGVERMRIMGNGNVGINTPSPTATLDVNGVIHSTTGIYTEGYMSCKEIKYSSDIQLKDIIADVTLPIEVITEAPAVLFTWKSGELAGKAAVGTIAQYWQKWLPSVVSENADNYLQMDYGATAMVSVINLARYTKSEIEQLKEENRRLKEQIIKLERR